MSSPIKVKLEEFTVNDLLPDYKDYLISKIPILNDEVLLQSILNYCYETMNTKYNKIQYIKESLKKFEGRLIEIYNFIIINKDETKKAIINIRNQKIIKSSPISAEALIEGVICATLEYYDRNITANSYININKNDKGKNRLFITMNKIIGKSLGTYIIENIYNNENIPQNMKNEVLMIVLKKISERLLYLQKICGFIHGDFHGENIFIIPINNGNDIDIKFIDFGYSVIRLPTIDNKKIILTGAVSENYERKYVMDLTSSSDEYLKGLDLFHLLQSLKGIENNIVMRNGNYYFKSDMHNISNETLIIFKDYNLFNELLEYLSKLYLINFNKKKFRGLSKYHNFTRSNNFYKIDDEYHILYPEKFIYLNINIQSLNNKKISKKSNSLFGNNENNDENNKPFLKTRGSLFGNNENNYENNKPFLKKRGSLFGNNENNDENNKSFLKKRG